MNTTPENPSTKKYEPGDLENPEEANLIWDEYKYRHDLIWRHIIRSTLVLVALLTVRYTKEFGGNFYLSLVAWILAIGYITFTLFIVHRELQLLTQIRDLHRKRQATHLRLNFGPSQNWWNFSRRVMVYLTFLLLLVILAGPISLCNDQVKISFAC
jgi:hypothetical protein